MTLTDYYRSEQDAPRSSIQSRWERVTAQQARIADRYSAPSAPQAESASAFARRMANTLNSAHGIHCEDSSGLVVCGWPEYHR
jgi:hypothetical protein